MLEEAESLSPEAPETYVEAAEWCVKEKVGDEPTVERLANIAWRSIRRSAVSNGSRFQRGPGAMRAGGGVLFPAFLAD